MSQCHTVTGTSCFVGFGEACSHGVDAHIERRKCHLLLNLFDDGFCACSCYYSTSFERI